MFLFQVHRLLIDERLGVGFIKIPRSKGSDAFPIAQGHRVGRGCLLGFLPFHLTGTDIHGSELLLKLGNLSIDAGNLRLVLRQRHLGRALSAYRRFLQVGKERTEAVKIFRGEGIELVIVAFAATEGAGHPHGGGVAHTVGEIFGGVLLGLRTTFARVHVQAIVAGRNELHAGAILDEVAGDLLARELVVPLVVVEGVDDVLAIERLGFVVI